MHARDLDRVIVLFRRSNACCGKKYKNMIHYYPREERSKYELSLIRSVAGNITLISSVGITIKLCPLRICFAEIWEQKRTDRESMDTKELMIN